MLTYFMTCPVTQYQVDEMPLMFVIITQITVWYRSTAVESKYNLILIVKERKLVNKTNETTILWELTMHRFIG